MYYIQNDMVVDWTYTILDHMMKANRLTYFKLPYVVLISKFIKHFGVDVEGELEESTSLLNGFSTLNMHKMVFTKIGNTWITENDAAKIVVVGSHDHEAAISGIHQTEEEVVESEPVAIELYNAHRKLVLPTLTLKGWFSTNFKSLTCLKMSIMLSLLQGFKNLMTISKMSMTSQRPIPWPTCTSRPNNKRHVKKDSNGLLSIWPKSSWASNVLLMGQRGC